MRALALFAALLATSPAGADEQPPASTEISVGAFLSVTGPSASFGLATHEGIKLAIDQYNAKPSTKRKVKLSVIDTAGKPAEGALAVTRLIDGGAVAIIGEVSSSITLTGAAIAQKRGVPLITPSATHPTITDVGEMISRTAMLDDDQAYALAMFARKLGVSKVAILSDQAQGYSKGLATSFETRFKAAGGTIVSTQSYATGATDFKTQLEAIVTAKPQAIFVPGYYMDAAAIAVQARALGIKLPFLGADGWDSDELGKLSAGALDGSYYVTHFSADDRRPIVRAFVKAFETAYKHKPDGLAVLGYDATNIVLAAIDRGKLSGADLAKAIRSTTKFAAVTGPITIDVYGQLGKPATIVKITKGKPVFATTIAPR
jgi:branched-chain amino acid transport system substrate-binding protein